MRGRRTAMSMVLSTLALLAAVGLSQANGPLALPRWTVDGGGGRSSGGPFALVGTLGQPDSGLLQGGPYVLRGGFLTPGTTVEVQHVTHLPVILRR